MAERKSKRKPISKSIRFEVFKRDGFTCQYCGRTAPNVVLECDHILPIAEGGTNEITNLITSCMDCNRGKGKKILSDTQTLDRQKKQLDELNQIREQTEMMILWRKELLQLENKQADAITELIEESTGFSVTDHGYQNIKKMIREFGFSEVHISTSISIDKYYDGESRESVALAFAKIGGICYNRKKARS